MKRTEQQQKAVDAPRGDILVSAAAGSGKTSVMTQRIVKRIAARELDIQNVLVMTFTDAAAKSMRSKIQKQLREVLAESTDEQQKSYISKQLVYLPSSSISTIHAFCLDVIRNFYYEATDSNGELLIELGFRIEDQGETSIILNGALDDLFEKYYEDCDADPDSGQTKDFLFLADAFGSPGNDLSLRDIIISIYHFLRSMPDYLKWIDKQRETLRQTICDFDNSIYYKSLYNGLLLRVENAREGMEEMREILSRKPCFYKNDKKNDNKNEKKNQDTLAELEGLYQFLDKVIRTIKDNIRPWDELYCLFQTRPDIPDLKGRSGDTEERKAFLELFADHFAELLYYTTGECGAVRFASQFLYAKAFVFTKCKKEIVVELMHMQPAIGQIFKILEELDKKYTSEKHEANMIDFSDFEHIALKILKSSQAGQYYRDKFQEIYIDEYQDTSSIQEAIMTQITKENCFMVGDIKQSIYRFRHARPQIFNSKKAAFDADSTCGTVLELNRNFRSVEGILSAVNDVFYQLMSQDAGEIEYDCGQALVADRYNHPEVPLPVELLLVDISVNDDIETPEDAGAGDNACDEGESGNADDAVEDEKTKYEKEALGVAIKIKELLETGVKPRDIAILARTRSICAVFAETLESFHIPAEQEQIEEFLDSYELKIMESLLKILDNTMQDIPLVSVMRSMLFNEGFSEDELLAIRISCRDRKYFYECCELYRTQGEEAVLKSKVDEFYKWLSNYREQLVYKSVSELIETIYIETGLLEYAVKMPNGQRRLSSLYRFQDWAHEYDNTRQAGLYSFVRYMESIHEKTQGRSPFGIESSQSDSVKVMTLHKSKGLEYEIVFLVGNNRSISSKDTRMPILISEETGVGFYYVNVEEQYKYPTPLIFAMKEGMRNAELAEEMRLLYVGMTRAMGRLYISGVSKNSDNLDGKGLAAVVDKVRKYPPGQTLPPHIVLSAKNTLEWIMMSIARNPFIDFSPAGISPAGISPTGESLTGEPSFGHGQKEDDNTKGNLFYSKAWSLNVERFEDVLKIASEILETPEKQDEEVISPNESLADDKIKNNIAAKFLYVYPFDKAARCPLKVTVSEIKRREQAMEPEYREYQADPGRNEESGKRPEQIRGINTIMKELTHTTKTALASNEVGIAVHSFLRYMDLDLVMEKPDNDNIILHLSQMLDFGMITGIEYQYLTKYADSFAAYLRSDLAKRIHAAGKKSPDYLFREIPFTININCKALFGSQGFHEDDFTMVQGMIDCWFVEDGHAIVVDYKTDRISGPEEQIIKVLDDRYKTQLAIYTLAIEQSTGQKVKESIIWLIDAKKEFKINTEDIRLKIH